MKDMPQNANTEYPNIIFPLIVVDLNNKKPAMRLTIVTTANIFLMVALFMWLEQTMADAKNRKYTTFHCVKYA